MDLASVPLDAYPKAAAAVISAVFAVAVAAGGPRRPVNLFLASFLALIAANQAAEAARAVVLDPAMDLRLFQLATVFAALDPFALFYFASIHPGRSRLNRGPALAAVLAPGVVLAFAAAGMQPDPGRGSFGWWAGLALSAYTAVVYGAVLAHVLARRIAGPEDPVHRALLPALSVAALPVVARVVATPAAMALGGLSWLGVAAFIGSVAAAWALRARRTLGPGPALRSVVAALALGVGLALLLQLAGAWTALGSLGLVQRTAPDAVQLLGQSGASLRWLLFGSFVSMAVLRHDMLGLTMAQRRGAARVLVGLAFLGAAAVLLGLGQGLWGPDGLGASPVEVAVLGAAVVLSQAFRSGVDRVATWLYGVPPTGEPALALETYRAALAQRVAEGRIYAGDPELARLRRELRLDPAAAEVLERMAAATPEGALTPGRVFAGRYRVVRFLGRGSSGRAYLAVDELLHREVALKEVLYDRPEDAGAALQEARLAAAVHHPRLVGVFDVVARPGSLVLVTEHLPGGTLAQVRAERGPLPPAEVARVLDDVLAALEALHAAGIVHRDLSPGNVLLAADGAAKVGDLGLARRRRGLTVGFDEPDALAGTPGFMAPEQRGGRRATPASDVYAAAALATALLASPRPPGLEAVLRRGLAEDPSARWPSASAMRAALREARLGPEQQQAPPHADDVAVPQRVGHALGQAAEVQGGAVAAVGQVQDRV